MNLSDGSRVLLCCFLAIAKETFGQIKPSNAVAEVGGEVIFNCSGSSFLPNWFMSKDGTTANQLPIAGSCNVNINSQNHYKTEPIGGATYCNLVVFDITMEQAGAYWCTESVTSYALLTVIESSPVITVNSTTSIVENESVVIECTLSHNGSVIPAPTLQPYFYWTNSIGQNISSSYDSTTNDTAVSQLRVITGRQNITAYTCHVYLQLIPTANSNYASNTPAVSSSNSSSAIEVFYSPSIPNITSSYQIITINGIACEVSNVTCTSSGNPSPVYEWFDTLENVSLIKSSNFDLAEINRKYTCVASNTIRNETLSSIYFHVPKNESTTKTCRFPRHESTCINVTGIDDGTGDCSKGYDGLNFACNADTYPNASYQWTGADNSRVYSKVYKNITRNGIYSCTAYFKQSTSNYTGNVMFTNGTSEKNVTECSNMPETPSTTTSTPPSANTNREGMLPADEGMDIAIAISVYEIANLISMGFFLAYYNMKTDENKNGNNSNIGALNKKALNDRFPWLEKMLPCMNPSHATAGKKCVGIFLFTLITISCGVFIFPILIIMIKKPCCGEDLHESQENSTLNLRLDDISGNFSGENRFPPPPSSLPSAPPSSHVGLVHRQASSSAGPPRPPPTSNKPTPSAVQLPQRPPTLLRPPAMSQPINREGAMEYAFLPFAMKPNLAPVQYLDEESHYAVLKRV